jgi:hypothetical protein
MEHDNIKSIEIDVEGRLHIITENVAFPMIYRAAVGINWNPDKHSLYSPKPREWTYLLWYNHILDVIEKEGFCKLELGEKTTWVNVPDELRKKIKK